MVNMIQFIFSNEKTRTIVFTSCVWALILGISLFAASQYYYSSTSCLQNNSIKNVLYGIGQSLIRFCSDSYQHEPEYLNQSLQKIIEALPVGTVLMSEINFNKTEKCSNKQQILITGVSGLIGRILFNYLTKTYPNKYDVFGIDRHMNISSRYPTNNKKNLEIEKIFPLPSDKFFQCDITDQIKLYEIIKQLQIQMIIHLAAVLETHPDLDTISHVNIQGTKNVFEAPDVDRIIFASSVRTVFGYLKREPYLSIYNETFNDKTMLKNLRKLTIADDPPLPSDENKRDQIYCQSKIIGEQIAKDIVKNGSKSIISMRFGWVNIDDQPGTTWHRTVWFSYRDVCSFIEKAIQAPLNISGTYFAVSNNHRLWLDLDDSKRDLGYVPQDGAENFQL